MTTAKDHVVIVGASLAGASVASALRKEGFEGVVTLVGDEPEVPYERPPLSKGILRGTATIEDACVHPASFYGDEGIDVRVGRADRVDVDGQRVHLRGGDAVPYDRLVLTTGGRAKRPPIPGIGLTGVHTLRSIDDAIAIRDAAGRAHEAVVVGMGFIGSEVAASLRQVGLDVTAVEGASTVLAGALGEDVGRVVELMHRDHGVGLVLGESVSRFEGNGSVERVVTATGRALPADLVVVGLGMEPNVELVAGTAVEVSNGVVVDELGRTSVPGVYAAGDVANHWHPLARRRIRVEHWNNAVKQGKAVARTIVGRGTPYDDVHFFWTEQYGDELQYYGLHGPWDDVVVRGDIEDRDFLALYLDDGRVTSAVAMGRTGELKHAKRLIAARAAVPRAQLEHGELGPITSESLEAGHAA